MQHTLGLCRLLTEASTRRSSNDSGELEPGEIVTLADGSPTTVRQTATLLVELLNGNTQDVVEEIHSRPVVAHLIAGAATIAARVITPGSGTEIADAESPFAAGFELLRQHDANSPLAQALERTLEPRLVPHVFHSATLADSITTACQDLMASSSRSDVAEVTRRANFLVMLLSSDDSTELAPLLADMEQSAGLRQTIQSGLTVAISSTRAQWPEHAADVEAMERFRLLTAACEAGPDLAGPSH
jgi:hypothetical protein